MRKVYLKKVVLTLTLCLTALSLSFFIIYKVGIIDTIIKKRFVNDLEKIGISFFCEDFFVKIFPLRLELKNAEFVNKFNQKPLFRLQSAIVELSLTELLSSPRKIEVNSTEIDGLELWVLFDEEGKSNFFGINLVEEGETKLSYSSASLEIKNGVLHFGDLTRKIQGKAHNLVLRIEPISQENHSFYLSTTENFFIYDGKKISPINIDIKGNLKPSEAEINQLKVTSPIVDSRLSGKIEGWKSLSYSFDVEAFIHLEKISKLFNINTLLEGKGRFTGKLTGEGESYRIEGELYSESVSTSGFNLKTFQGFGSFTAGKNLYEASGQILIELLNTGSLKIDRVRLNSNVRGTGDSIKWIGDLQSAAINSPLGTIVSLYMKDASAEYEEKKLKAFANSLYAQSLISQDFKADSIFAKNLNYNHDLFSSTSLKVRSFKAENILAEGLTAEKIYIYKVGETVESNNVKAKSVRFKESRITNLEANKIKASKNGKISAENASAKELRIGNTKISSLSATNITANQSKNQTSISTNLLRVKGVESETIKLGAFDIAGVKVSVNRGLLRFTSNDIKAGNLVLKERTGNDSKLDNLFLAKPVFTLEPSGKYRASMDASISGGQIGSVRLGTAKTSVILTNEKLELKNISAEVLNGKLSGSAVISFSAKNDSIIRAEFSELDLSKLVVAQSGKILPLSGKLHGNLELSFPQTNLTLASGQIKTSFRASAVNNPLIPINGEINASGEKGVFTIKQGNLKTEKSHLTALGTIDLNKENSNLDLVLTSDDASEIQYFLTAFEILPELEKKLTDNKIQIAGRLRFQGKFTGKLNEPKIEGNASLENLLVREKPLGSLKGNVSFSPKLIKSNGKLENNESFIDFSINIPQPINNNISFYASINNFEIENLLQALPLEGYLPENFYKVKARVFGKVFLDKLPNKATGNIELKSKNPTLAEEKFDYLELVLKLNEDFTTLEKLVIQDQNSYLLAKGNYETETTLFSLESEGKNLQAPKFAFFLPKNIPSLDGTINFAAKIEGKTLEVSTYNITANGTVKNFSINQRRVGNLNLQSHTENQKVFLVLTVNLENQQQKINAEIDLAEEILPFKIYSNLENADLSPYLTPLIREQDIQVSVLSTGRLSVEGSLVSIDNKGQKHFSLENLKGRVNLETLATQINEIPIVSKEPVQISFNTKEIIFEKTVFVSAGSTIVISGSKAVQEQVSNNLFIEGRINLRILDIVLRNAFLTGFSNVSVRLTGTNRDLRLSGTAKIENATFSTFIGSERLNFDKINGKIIFTSNQIQIEKATGFLGGGRIQASGGAILKNLKLEGFRLELTGRNITAPLPKNFVTTGNAEVTITTRRVGDNFDTLIAGTIYARRAVYSKDIDLADIIGNRREGAITEGANSGFSAPRLELTLIGRDALIVRNNIADLVASVDLRVTGDADSPILIGRIISSEGTLFYRNEKYSLRRGLLEFPSQTDRSPFLNLQAETEIQSYRIEIDLLGELSEASSLSLNVRSNPPLPQADIVSLITTGSLANTETGIPTATQSINTAAEILTDTFVNSPIRRATDRLFGLNRFEISPVISGIRQTPTARLTVGRQINRNLLVTYSTNLSEDQRQILALEYRISNRLSLIAQYEQKSLNNFVRSRDGFSFEIRLRRRF